MEYSIKPKSLGERRIIHYPQKRIIGLYVAVMHILTFILIFVVGSIIAACDGDYSGIAAIGKFVGFFVLLFAVLWLFTQPVLLIIAIIVLVLIVICCSAK